MEVLPLNHCPKFLRTNQQIPYFAHLEMRQLKARTIGPCFATVGEEWKGGELVWRMESFPETVVKGGSRTWRNEKDSRPKYGNLV